MKKSLIVLSLSSILIGGVQAEGLVDRNSKLQLLIKRAKDRQAGVKLAPLELDKYRLIENPQPEPAVINEAVITPTTTFHQEKRAAKEAKRKLSKEEKQKLKEEKALSRSAAKAERQKRRTEKRLAREQAKAEKQLAKEKAKTEAELAKTLSQANIEKQKSQEEQVKLEIQQQITNNLGQLQSEIEVQPVQTIAPTATSDPAPESNRDRVLQTHPPETTNPYLDIDKSVPVSETTGTLINPQPLTSLNTVTSQVVPAINSPIANILTQTLPTTTPAIVPAVSIPAAPIPAVIPARIPTALVPAASLPAVTPPTITVAPTTTTTVKAELTTPSAVETQATKSTSELIKQISSDIKATDTSFSSITTRLATPTSTEQPISNGSTTTVDTSAVDKNAEYMLVLRKSLKSLEEDAWADVKHNMSESLDYFAHEKTLYNNPDLDIYYKTILAFLRFSEAGLELDQGDLADFEEAEAFYLDSYDILEETKKKLTIDDPKSNNIKEVIGTVMKYIEEDLEYIEEMLGME